MFIQYFYLSSIIIFFILLYLLLEAALLQQLVCLIQDKESDAGDRQHAQLNELLDTT